MRGSTPSSSKGIHSVLSAASMISVANVWVERIEATQPRRGLGDAVREERVRAPTVDLGQPVMQRGLDVVARDLGDAGLAEQAQGEDQVGACVGVDPMAGKRGWQAQVWRDPARPAQRRPLSPA